MLKCFNLKLQSNSRNDSVVSFSALLPCPIPISEDQSLWDQISTQDSRFKPRYQNQKLPNMANHWIHQKVKKYRSPTFPILYPSPLLLLLKGQENLPNRRGIVRVGAPCTNLYLNIGLPAWQSFLYILPKYLSFINIFQR